MNILLKTMDGKKAHPGSEAFQMERGLMRMGQTPTNASKPKKVVVVRKIL